MREKIPIIFFLGLSIVPAAIRPWSDDAEMSTSASEILSTNPKNQSCDSIRNISPKSMASPRPVLLIHSVGGRGLGFWFAVGPSSSLREVPGAASLEPTVWRGLACVFAEAFLIEFSRTNMGWFPARVFWLWAGASPKVEQTLAVATMLPYQLESSPEPHVWFPRRQLRCKTWHQVFHPWMIHYGLHTSSKRDPYGVLQIRITRILRRVEIPRWSKASNPCILYNLLARIWSYFSEVVSSSFGSMSMLRVTISKGDSIFQLWYSDREQDDCLGPHPWLKGLNKISIDQWDDSVRELQFCHYGKCPIWLCRRLRSFFITAPLNLLKMPRKFYTSITQCLPRNAGSNADDYINCTSFVLSEFCIIKPGFNTRFNSMQRYSHQSRAALAGDWEYLQQPCSHMQQPPSE